MYFSLCCFIHTVAGDKLSFKHAMKFCFNFLKGVWRLFFLKKSKSDNNINILNSFFITVLKYEDRGKLYPIPAPVRLQTEGALCLEASPTRFNKTLKRDDPIRNRSEGVNTNPLASHVRGPRKSNAGFLPLTLPGFKKCKIRWYL